MKILGAIYNAPPSQAADRLCAKCGEEVPGTFDSCWQCDTLREGPPATSGDPGIIEN